MQDEDGEEERPPIAGEMVARDGGNAMFGENEFVLSTSNRCKS